MQIELDSRAPDPLGFRDTPVTGQPRRPRPAPFRRGRDPRGIMRGIAIAIMLSLALWVALYMLGDILF